MHSGIASFFSMDVYCFLCSAKASCWLQLTPHSLQKGFNCTCTRPSDGLDGIISCLISFKRISWCCWIKQVAKVGVGEGNEPKKLAV